MTRLEEIKGTILAMKHWQTVNPEIQPHPYEDGPGPDMEWLVSQLEKAIEMTQWYATLQFEDTPNGFDCEGFTKRMQGKAREFLEGLKDE